jgi:hypothetical protein
MIWSVAVQDSEDVWYQKAALRQIIKLKQGANWRALQAQGNVLCVPTSTSTGRSWRKSPVCDSNKTLLPDLQDLATTE